MLSWVCFAVRAVNTRCRRVSGNWSSFRTMSYSKPSECGIWSFGEKHAAVLIARVSRRCTVLFSRRHYAHAHRDRMLPKLDVYSLVESPDCDGNAGNRDNIYSTNIAGKSVTCRIDVTFVRGPCRPQNSAFSPISMIRLLVTPVSSFPRGRVEFALKKKMEL